MHLLLALDQGFEQLAAVALTSYLLHQRFESVVLVTPDDQRLHRLEGIAEGFGTPVVWQPIGPEAALHRLEPALQPYFFCIEALRQSRPGRYLYADADTLCVRGLSALEDLPLNVSRPLAACSHGRPLPDRSLVLGLESPFHYFNAGVMLFDSSALTELITPAAVVDFAMHSAVLCRFREQCALNALLRGRVQFLPGQFNLLSWMRERMAQNPWHDLAVNAMATCLKDVRQQMAIVHLSAGALPNRLPEERHEPVDRYWMYLHQALAKGDALDQLVCFADW